MLTNSMINSFVMAANKNEMLFAAQFPSNLLSEPSAARGHQNHMRLLGPDGFHSGEDWFRFHDHAWTAPIRRFVCYMMFVGCPVPYIQAPNLNQEVFLRLL